MSRQQVDVQVLRDFARDRSELQSLRAVAPTIPLTHTTLHNFLKGAAPHPRVRRLITLWYLREHGVEGAAEEGPREALSILSGGLGGEEAARASQEILDVLERAYTAAGRRPPEWIGAIRAASRE